MNVEALYNMVQLAHTHSGNAVIAMSDERYDDAKDAMERLAVNYEEYCKASADEAPDEQKDDAQDEESKDEKGCVVDKPRTGHNVPS